MLARYTVSSEETYFLPLRIELKPEYVTVFSPLVKDVSEVVVKGFHRAVLDMLKQCLEQPSQSDSELRKLGDKIVSRSLENQPVDSADILAEVDSGQQSEGEVAPDSKVPSTGSKEEAGEVSKDATVGGS